MKYLKYVFFAILIAVTAFDASASLLLRLVCFGDYPKWIIYYSYFVPIATAVFINPWIWNLAWPLPIFRPLSYSRRVVCTFGFTFFLWFVLIWQTSPKVLTVDFLPDLDDAERIQLHKELKILGVYGGAYNSRKGVLYIKKTSSCLLPQIEALKASLITERMKVQVWSGRQGGAEGTNNPFAKGGFEGALKTTNKP